MDHGTLTDNNGREADFRNVVLIMTTNAGARKERNGIGFVEQDHSIDGGDAIKRTFTPEFRNRLDAMVPFAPLSTDTLKYVVDKFLTELQAQLDERQVR